MRCGLARTVWADAEPQAQMSQASPCVGATNLQAWDTVGAESAENEVKVRAVTASGKL